MHQESRLKPLKLQFEAVVVDAAGLPHRATCLALLPVAAGDPPEAIFDSLTRVMKDLKNGRAINEVFTEITFATKTPPQGPIVRIQAINTEGGAMLAD